MSAYFANVLPNNLLTASDLFGSTQSSSANAVTNVNNSSSASTLSSGSSSSSSNSSASNSSSSLSVNSLNQQSCLISDQRAIQHQASHQQLNVMNQISCNTGEMLVNSGNHLLNLQEINIFEENSSRFSSNSFNVYNRLPILNDMKTHSNYSALSGFNNTSSSLQLQQQQQHLVHSQSQQQLVPSQQLIAGASNASLAIASGNSSHYNTSVSSSSSPDYMNPYKHQMSANQLDSSSLQMANYSTHIIQGQPTQLHSQHANQSSISNSHLTSNQSVQHLNPVSQQQQQQQNAAAFATATATMQQQQHQQQQQSNLSQMAPPGQNYIYPWMRQAANVKTSAKFLPK